MQRWADRRLPPARDSPGAHHGEEYLRPLSISRKTRKAS